MSDDSQVNECYDAAVSFLYDRIDFERMPIMPYRSVDAKLGRMRRLLALLGNPHERLPTVHVAGTKGKGSTCAMISSILSQAGFQTGVYSSPHLHRVEERFVLNHRVCDAAKMTELIQQIRPVVEQLDLESDGHAGPTFFEVTTALAFLYFALQDVHFAIFEVGLGGRLDSTNVCHPIVSIITSISYDHTKQLGNTLEKIAFEKAGIIKPQVPAISGVVSAGPADVIRRAATERASPLFERKTAFDMKDVRADDDGCYSGDYVSEHWRIDNVRVGMRGSHQLENAALAIATCERLREMGYEIQPHHVRQGLAQAGCPARIETVSRNPEVIVDAAHNGASAAALINTIRSRLAQFGSNRVLVFGTTQGKDVSAMFRVLLPEFQHVVLTRYLNNPRAVEPEELARRAAPFVAPDCQISLADTPRAAIDQATRWAGNSGFICVTGSFFLAAECREIFLIH